VAMALLHMQELYVALSFPDYFYHSSNILIMQSII
jgi:hypothetical protein